ncbi:DUF397 domain-containing protein [Paractinoplanes toevensis]|uniref:DUF397 domain-containing protein n=1 Tax=Paractinoplanes toevensis TaxID=571911 RepID=A0A919W1Z8_9ACTN|nr:DUF397 domain-containing protein [Actinoplanes toevensis]GIM91009.1 hypothetical protein Ato02nite_028020 [Actinoplanes toevensis]
MYSVEIHWARSSYCANNSCLEVARAGDGILVRDSKNPDAGPLAVTGVAWTSFVRGVKAGEFDGR